MTESITCRQGVVLRIGELFLKGNNRFLFENMLEKNTRRLLTDRPDVTLKREHGRFFLVGAFDPDLLSRLRWLFGFASYSPVIFCDKDIGAIEQAALGLARESMLPPGATFRITVNRADKKFPFVSVEVGRIVGSAVAVDRGFKVLLDKPTLDIGVEIGRETTFVWSKKCEGGGGLPVGSSGQIALLLSGGIDSPVAGHLLQRRGLELICVYFHAFPYTGDGAKQKVIDLATVLAKRQKALSLYVVPFAKVQECIRDGADPRFLVLLYRRAMVRIAERIALSVRIHALASGENLGQVASQTLENIATIEDAATVPIIRPLVAFDKGDTIALAKQIGTFDISIMPHEDCCSLFVPKHPETKGSALKAIAMENSMPDLDALLTAAIDSVEKK